MRKALDTKFGTNTEPALPPTPIFAMSFGQDTLDTAQAEVLGTNAVVRMPGRADRSDEMRLLKIGSVWRVGGHKGDSPQALKPMESMERISHAIDAFTQDVLNGKFSSAEEALRLMRSRIGSTMGRKR